MMYKILTLNNISVKGLDCLPRDRYEIASEIQHPDAVLVRSFKMHDWQIPQSLQAVGRAGAGVNNIPLAKMSSQGIPVFNAPGANANAVKELVLAGMLIAARNLGSAWDFARNLSGSDEEINKAVEAGKKNFVGFELPNKTLGIIGLGAIGVKVANAAVALGMNVIGYDPQITVKNAWQMSSEVKQALSLDDLFSRVDFVSFHVPLIEATRHMLNAERLNMMRKNVVVLNFARDGIVDDDAVIDALNQKQIHAYVCDFPSNLLKNHPKVITLPHLGASTVEAEDNCAVMVAEQVRDYLENGTIRNSVNFPEAQMPRLYDRPRLAISNANVPNMLGQISTAIAKAGLNIADMLNQSRGDLAYTLVDVEQPIPQTVLDELGQIHGVLRLRLL
jgi:D-3-phosphoglycerate dehydrogenase / 2-oxoglutarate reductase